MIQYFEKVKSVDKVDDQAAENTTPFASPFMFTTRSAGCGLEIGGAWGDNDHPCASGTTELSLEWSEKHQLWYEIKQWWDH